MNFWEPRIATSSFTTPLEDVWMCVNQSRCCAGCSTMVTETGPIFNYKTRGDSRGVHLFVYEGKLYVRFNKRDYSATETVTLIDTTPVARGWTFVGASYDHGSGEAKLWVDGVVVKTKNIGARLELATQDSIRMGVMSDNKAEYFKGRITQMQVYNESLTQGQIQTIQKRTPRVVGKVINDQYK